MEKKYFVKRRWFVHVPKRKRLLKRFSYFETENEIISINKHSERIIRKFLGPLAFVFFLLMVTMAIIRTPEDIYGIIIGGTLLLYLVSLFIYSFTIYRKIKKIESSK